MPCGLYGQYKVESDVYGWPKHFTGDRDQLVREVKSILEEHGSLEILSIYAIGQCRFNWRFGALWDAIYAVLERALRDVAKQTWSL